MKSKTTNTKPYSLKEEIRNDRQALRSGRLALDKARTLDRLHCRELTSRKLDLDEASLRLDYAKARKEKPEIAFLK